MSPPTYVSTGITELDRTLGGGLVPGRLVLFAGWAGVGKTTLLLQLAEGFTVPGVLFTTDEDEDHIRQQAQRVGAAIRSSSTSPGDGAMTIEEILERAADLKSSLIIADSLQEIRSSTARLKGEVAQNIAVMNALKTYCAATKTAAIITTGTTKKGEPRGGVEVEHIADTVMVLDYPSEDDKDAPGTGEEGIRVLAFSKHRTGKVAMKSYWRMTATGLVTP